MSAEVWNSLWDCCEDFRTPPTPTAEMHKIELNKIFVWSNIELEHRGKNETLGWHALHLQMQRLS